MNALRRITDFILQNRIQAAAVAFIIAFIPYISSLSVVIAAFVTLRKDVWSGALVFVASILPAILSYFAAHIPADEAPLALMMLSVVMVNSFSIWIFAVLLKKYGSWGLILDSAIIFSVVFVGLVHIIYPDIQSFWSMRLNEYFTKLVSMNSDAIAHADIKKITTIFSRFTTGLIAASIIVNAILQLILARFWQALLFNPGGLRVELYNIRLSYIAGLLYILTFGLAYAHSAIAIDLMPMFCIVFSLAGFSLMHYMLGPLKNGWLWLLIAYIVIISALQKTIFIMSFIALLDIGFNFRQRIKRNQNIV